MTPPSKFGRGLRKRGEPGSPHVAGLRQPSAWRALPLCPRGPALAATHPPCVPTFSRASCQSRRPARLTSTTLTSRAHRPAFRPPLRTSWRPHRPVWPPRSRLLPAVEVEFPPVASANARGDGSAASERLVHEANAAFAARLAEECGDGGRRRVTMVGCTSGALSALGARAFSLRDAVRSAPSAPYPHANCSLFTPPRPTYPLRPMHLRCPSCLVHLRCSTSALAAPPPPRTWPSASRRSQTSSGRLSRP